MQLNYAIVFVSDMKRSVAFYRDVVGITLKYETPGWSEFVTEGATLALHSTDEAEPVHGSPNQPGRCRPGFSVTNLAEFHKRLVGKNVPCLQEPTETFGVLIAQYTDPDGLTLSVSELMPGV